MRSLGRLANAFLAAGLITSSGVLAAEIPTDRVIVRLKGGAPAQTRSAADRESLADRLSARVGERLVPLRVMGDGAQVMQLPRKMPPAAIEARYGHLADDPDVIEIVPDRLFVPALTPSDPQYGDQWYLSAGSGINAPAA